MRKPLYRYKRVWLLAIILIFIGYLLTLRPVQIILQTAPDKPRAQIAEPVIPDVSQDQWLAERDGFLTQLEETVYGQFPDNLKISILSRTDIASPDDMVLTKIEALKLEILNTVNRNQAVIDFVLVSPKNGKPNKTLILTQNFCPNHNVVPARGIPVPENLGFSCEGGGFFANLMSYFFGRYIVSPPFEMILEKGYTVGVLHPPQFIADSPQIAGNQLETFFSDYSTEKRPGSLITWAALSTEIARLLHKDYDGIITWGHSRYGKTALLAAAYSEHIDGAIAHQSGTGGASLFRDKPGETFADIVAGYPHWFGNSAPNFAQNPYLLPLDQHFLLAALAPKPVLLGNARRDVWSDPEGAFRAAKAASKTYQAFGEDGLTAEKLRDFVPGDKLSFWIRPGTHGVVEEDWPAFLEFLMAHFPAD